MTTDLNTFKKGITLTVEALIAHQNHPTLETRRTYTDAFREVALELKWHADNRVPAYFGAWMDTEGDLFSTLGFFSNHPDLIPLLTT